MSKTWTELKALLDGGLTSWLAADLVETRLRAAGLREGWPREDIREPFFVRVHPGVVLALRPGTVPLGEGAFVWALAHLDAPAFRVKRKPDDFDGLQRYLTERYGSPVPERFLDVPLKMAGRVFTAEGEGVRETRFTGQTEGVMPSLAPHLGKEGTSIDPQTQLAALWSLEELPFETLLAREADLGAEPILSHEVFLVPAAGARRLGAEGELVWSPRLDDLALVHGALEGFLGADPSPGWQGLLLCNHEEVGSMSREGALSGLLAGLAERIGALAGLERTGLFDVLARSVLLSLDMAHGDHPGYPGAQDRQNAPRLGAGPAVKLSAAGRYASDPREEAWVRKLAGDHGLPLQSFQNRSDVKGGTTLGPMAGAFSGMAALDLGVPMLAMHSAGEIAALRDIQTAADLVKYVFMERM